MIDIDHCTLTIEKANSGSWRITSDTPELRGLDHAGSTLHEALCGASNAISNTRMKATGFFGDST